ncbi:MAG TPA: hypothetical protein VFD32_22080 [Dehalococcoidia bacterium]|nr:hypothetical protein [Dehalococcoidia bacterium]
MTADRNRNTGQRGRRGNWGGDAARFQQLLMQVPVHIFVFDARLVCRFAAPSGPAFLGRTVDQLVSAPALEVFSRASAIVPRLLQVIQSGTSWVHPALTYPADPSGQWPAGVWQVHVQPWHDGLTEVEAAESVPETTDTPAGRIAAPGVLVCCAPIATEDGAEQRAASDEWHTEGRRSAQLLERIRTKLTVIRGNVDLFTRRELRAGGQPPRELARITAAVDDAERLLREYERSSRLTTRHPDLP